MAVLVTGAAGFVGFHVATALLDRGTPVIGLDNLNDYYDPNLKQARLGHLQGRKGFTFHRIDVVDSEGIKALCATHSDIDSVIHLAAQAGVRYSLQNPLAYIRSNVEGHLSILEACRRLPKLKHLVYASSSSVYGGNTKVPFATEDRVDDPLSLYAVSKRACELTSRSYAHLYGIPQTGLRFFTVYGPWGRPDMAAYIFASKIYAGEAIPVFNHGKMERDFTYIDDIVKGVVAALDRPPPPSDRTGKLYNLGNSHPEKLLDFIAILERAIGRKAVLDLLPMQPGDVPRTYADIEASRKDLDYDPRITIEEGIPQFIAWYRKYHNL
ncbi:MAG: NAD-dependent epimerase/dehydratase family protein [Alphaproteobacteria bacterium]